MKYSFMYINHVFTCEETHSHINRKKKKVFIVG